MPSSDLSYRRLGPSVRTFGSAYSLWFGDDHLLQVSATLGVENYRRWYFREIQAVIVRRTSRRAIWNLIWGIIAALMLAATAGLVSLAATSAATDGQAALYVFAGIAGAVAVACAAIVLWNSLLGPTCTVFVQTPTGLQSMEVPARRRAIDTLLVQLRPLIEAAQLENAKSA